jgi:precorrin-2 dehydrogenase / sirohydrochlorin ferrochelatase
MRIPAVLNLDGPVIIFGGGYVGSRKVEYVLKFTDSVTVIDEQDVDLPEQATLIKRRVEADSVGDLIPDGTSLVIAALDSEEINLAIALNCRSRGILVNVVDVPDPSTVLFQAISKVGDLTVSISTAGRCPFLARKIREDMDGTLDTWVEWLEILAPIRGCIVGMEEKKHVLQTIYDDPVMKELINSGQREEARKRAEEVYDHVCG